MISNHEIDYKIYGEELQFVEIELDPNETAIAESGAFMMMDSDIQMNTIFGDGSQQQDTSLMGKLFSAGRPMPTTVDPSALIRAREPDPPAMPAVVDQVPY